jgi:hypothetical protein
VELDALFQLECPLGRICVRQEFFRDLGRGGQVVGQPRQRGIEHPHPVVIGRRRHQQRIERIVRAMHHLAENQLAAALGGLCKRRRSAGKDRACKGGRGAGTHHPAKNIAPTGTATQHRQERLTI